VILLLVVSLLLSAAVIRIPVPKIGVIKPLVVLILLLLAMMVMLVRMTLAILLKDVSILLLLVSVKLNAYMSVVLQILVVWFLDSLIVMIVTIVPKIGAMMLPVVKTYPLIRMMETSVRMIPVIPAVV
jgi:hypothetical protein